MNREIKFRAYIKNDYNKELIGKILDVSSIQLKIKKVIIGYSLDKSNYGNKSFSFNDIELMQYTGLHDKNGKEIYEGDIVLLTCYNYEEPVFGGEFKVIYDDINGMWLLVDLENKDRGFAFGEIRSYYKAEFEIIGNVFEKGIKKIWELHKKGYSINKISKELNYDWLQVKTRIDEIYDNLELLGGK